MITSVSLLLNPLIAENFCFGVDILDANNGYKQSVPNVSDPLYSGWIPYGDILQGGYLNGDHVLDQMPVVPFDFTYRIKSLCFSGGAVDVSPDRQIYASSEGRKSGSSKIETYSAMMSSLSKSQNLSANGISEPSTGWGFSESAWNFNTVSTPESTRYQQFNRLVNTTELIDDIAKYSFLIPYINRDSTEGAYLLENCFSGGGTQINIPSDGRLVSAKLVKGNDIYTNIDLKYDYDIVTDKYKKRITVIKPESSSYSADYVTGISNSANASDLWGRCNRLYKKYATTQKLPDDRSENIYISSEDDAYRYLTLLLYWMGADSEFVMTRKTVEIEIPHERFKQLGLWFGSSVVMSIPNVTEDGTYSGIVTGISYNHSNKTYGIQAELALAEERTVYIETGIADTNIIETGTQTDNIIEG